LSAATSTPISVTIHTYIHTYISLTLCCGTAQAEFFISIMQFFLNFVSVCWLISRATKKFYFLDIPKRPPTPLKSLHMSLLAAPHHTTHSHYSGMVIIYTTCCNIQNSAFCPHSVACYSNSKEPPHTDGMLCHKRRMLRDADVTSRVSWTAVM
jgi:hypothetical protein